MLDSIKPADALTLLAIVFAAGVIYNRIDQLEVRVARIEKRLLRVVVPASIEDDE